MNEPTDNGEGGTGRRCPICGRLAEHRWRPFCSKRCADVDLSRWLRGAYAVPAVESDEEDEETPPLSSGRDEDGADRDG